MLKELTINAEKSFIGGWFIEDETFCDRMIDFFEQSNLTKTGVVFSSKGVEEVRTDIKDSIDLVIGPEMEITREYVIELEKVVTAYKEKFYYAGDTGPWKIEAINVQKYNPNGAYHRWHTERSSGGYPGVARHLVFMTYLNDVEDEGETEFFYQQVKVKPRKGLTLIWPSDWTHTHRGIPSPSDTKYIITGWYHFFMPEENRG